MEQKTHYSVEIEGRVQGVGFRYSAVNQAAALGITGYVKNLPSGNVYLEIEGPENAVLKMLRWCHSGPSTARVERVSDYKGELKNYDSFRVMY